MSSFWQTATPPNVLFGFHWKKFTQIFVVRNKGTFRVTFALEIHNSNTLSSRTFSCLLHCLKMKCDWKWSIFGFVSFSTAQCFLKIAIDKIVSRITVRVTNTESVKLNFTHITEEARLDQTLKLNSWPEVTSQSHTAGATYGRFKTQQRRKLLLCLKRSDWTKDQRIICKGWLVERFSGTVSKTTTWVQVPVVSEKEEFTKSEKYDSRQKVF